MKEDSSRTDSTQFRFTFQGTTLDLNMPSFHSRGISDPDRTNNLLSYITYISKMCVFVGMRSSLYGRKYVIQQCSYSDFM